MSDVWRAARYVPDGAGIKLRDPQVLVVAGNQRHADSFLDYQGVVGPTWVLDRVPPNDPLGRLVQKYGHGLYVSGISDEGDLMLYRYDDSARLYPIGELP